MSNWILPSLFIFAVIRKAFHDKSINSIQCDFLWRFRIDGHCNQCDVTVRWFYLNLNISLELRFERDEFRVWVISGRDHIRFGPFPIWTILGRGQFGSGSFRVEKFRRKKSWLNKIWDEKCMEGIILEYSAGVLEGLNVRTMFD